MAESNRAVRDGAARRATPAVWLACLALLISGLAGPPRASAAQSFYRPGAPVRGPATWQYLRDPGGRLDLAAVRKRTATFRTAERPTLNFGFDHAAYWLRLPLTSVASDATTVYLSIAQPTLDEVRLYVLRDGVLQQSEQAGDRVAPAERALSASHPLFPIRLLPGAHYELYLRVQSRMGVLLLPTSFQSSPQVERARTLSLLFNGGVTGVFAALLLYNLLLWLSLRHRAYLYYLLLLTAGYFACVTLTGFGHWMLFGRWTWFANQGLLLSTGTGYLFSMLFARALLETARIRWLDRLLLAVAAAASIVALSAWLPAGWGYRLAFVLVFVTPLSGTLAGIVCLRRGHPQARFYLLAELAVAIGLPFFGLTGAGWLPFSLVGHQAVTLGATGEAVLLALALADRIRALERAAARAQTATRMALEQRQQELERGVQARTRELEEARRQAEVLATTDALTGVYNRRGLLPLIEAGVQRSLAQGIPLSLVSFDLDQFKHVNDDFGHAEGDRVLRELVTLTRQLVRATDLVGRTGGEEFTLVLAASREQAVQLAERLRRHLQLQLVAGPERRPVTASFGVAALGGVIADLEALQRAADAALYRAKNRGRNRVESFDATTNDTTRSRAILSSGS